ncbi:MAG: DMP19 family protein [Gemmataceae bacterium]
MNWYDAAGDYYKRAWLYDDKLSVLATEWQRELVALMLVNREVNNGGYVQFFANCGREVYEYASQSLRHIGARRMAEIVDACQALIDEHSPATGESSDDRATLLPNQIIGRDGQTIKESGSVLLDLVLERVSELSFEFMGYPEDVGALAQAHFAPLIEGDKHAAPGT